MAKNSGNPAVPGQRLIGAVVPVGALRGKEETGVGEFLDLIDFAELCVDMGAGLIQILPVNDTGYESSPYSALTAFALHPLYLRLSALPEAADFSKDIAALGKQFDGEVRFPYYKVLKAKMELLRKIYAAHEQTIAADMAKTAAGSLGAWLAENSWVKPYAVFRRLKEANGEKSWKEWESCRQISAGGIEALWNDKNLQTEHFFWVWLQEALDRQFTMAAKAIRDKGILLEGDLPILMNEDSCDVWAHPENFRAELSAGAPPDMYSPDGQNWGFPIYHWEAQTKDGYTWWKNRLKAAARYYDAYRIDHVLGFFRIWASSRADNSSALGRFVPYIPLEKSELEALGFDKSRIRWVSRPHVPTGEVWEALRNNWGGFAPETEVAAAAQKTFDAALDRIGSEELWLFKETIKGEKDIAALDLHTAARNYLTKAWHDRLFLECETGQGKTAFFPVWYYHYSRSYASLGENERAALETVLKKHRTESEQIWETEGEKLLSALTASSQMLPCAEDLGAVPDCVPRVLSKLNILGLRVVRWSRRWDKEGEPYVPFDQYPEQSVCTPAVHDSSTLREWWNTEADQAQFAGFLGVPSLPRVYNPGTAKIILKHTAASASRFRVFQIQDLLHLSQKWYAPDPAAERINVPGTTNEFNWTYRLPAPVRELQNDGDLIQGVKELAKI